MDIFTELKAQRNLITEIEAQLDEAQDQVSTLKKNLKEAKDRLYEIIDMAEQPPLPMGEDE